MSLTSEPSPSGSPRSKAPSTIRDQETELRCQLDQLHQRENSFTVFYAEFVDHTSRLDCDPAELTSLLFSKLNDDYRYQVVDLQDNLNTLVTSCYAAEAIFAANPDLSARLDDAGGPGSHISIEDMDIMLEGTIEKWRQTDHSKALRALAGHVSKTQRKIKKAVCVGLGTLMGEGHCDPRIFTQLALFLDVLDQLDLDGKIEIFAQDPDFEPLDVRFLNHLGIYVCTDPDIADVVDEETFVFDAHVMVLTGIELLKLSRNVPFWIGSDMESTKECLADATIMDHYQASLLVYEDGCRTIEAFLETHSVVAITDEVDHDEHCIFEYYVLADS